MSPEDIVVIVAESLPLPQALDLVKWYVQHHQDCINHPSMLWWMRKHANAIFKRF